MSSICIVTDSTAQFASSSVPRTDVHVIHYPMSLNGTVVNQPNFMEDLSLPVSASEQVNPHIIVPSVEVFSSFLTDLNKKYDTIIGIFASSSLLPGYQRALEASQVLRGKAGIFLIDSCTISVGLGHLVQVASEAAANNKSAVEIEKLIRSIIPYIFTIICTPALSYLYYNKYIDRAQSVVGEMLGLYPIFTLEEGRLSPLEKVRTQRHAFSYLIEFLDEFDHLNSITILQNSLSTQTDNTRMIREHSHDHFPRTMYNELQINPTLSALFGPSTFGLIIVENFSR